MHFIGFFYSVQERNELLLQLEGFIQNASLFIHCRLMNSSCSFEFDFANFKNHFFFLLEIEELIFY